MKNVLLESQRDFYKDALTGADKYPVKGYIFTEPDDNGKMSEFIKVLLGHQIRVFNTIRDFTGNGITYRTGKSYLVPLLQTEYRFIRSLFEPVREFTDSTFYDISTWVLPMSFNISYCELTSLKDTEGLKGSQITNAPLAEGRLISPEHPYAYLFEWSEYYAPKALYKIQDKGIITRVSTRTFTSAGKDFKKSFSYGTIMVSVSGQSLKPEDLQTLMESTAKSCGITIYGVETGLTPEGIDLGSNRIMVLRKPSVAMVGGNGANSSARYTVYGSGHSYQFIRFWIG